MKVFLRAACCLIAGTAAAALFVGLAEAQDKPTIKFLSSNNQSCVVYPQFVGQGLGFWDDLGIKVELLSSDTSIPYVAFLQNGDADIVFLDAPQAIQAVDAGLPIKVIYEAFQASSEGTIVPADSPIKSVQDLKDVTIGMASDRDSMTLRIALDAIGTTLEKNNVKTVVVEGSGPILATALRDKTIDGYAGGAADRAGIEAAGFNIRNITSSMVTQTPGNVFAVWGPTLEEKRDVLQRFLKGWAMTQQASVLDTRVTASVCRTFVPEVFEDLEVGKRMIDNAVYNLQLRRTRLLGELQPDIWRSIQEAYQRLGEFKEVRDPATFLDSSFVDGANDFTTDGVKTKIREWAKDNPEKLIP